MNDLTFNVLKIILSIAVALVTAYLIPFIKSKISKGKYDELASMVNIAVLAAEQTIGSGNGSLKKSEVIEFITAWMNGRGIAISDEQLSQLIEACVFSMNKEIK